MLETRKVSRAAADQRRGRAGRVEPGVCYRLWGEGQHAALQAFDAPEMLEADLSGLALDLAGWGVSDPAQLNFLDPPPGPAWSEAVERCSRGSRRWTTRADHRRGQGAERGCRCIHGWRT